MSDPTGNDTSFDPRSWLRDGGRAPATPGENRDRATGANAPGPDSSANVERDTTSFNPKAWNVHGSESAPEPEQDGAAETSAARSGPASRKYIAVGLLAATALLFAGGLHLHRLSNVQASGADPEPASQSAAPAEASALDVEPDVSLRNLKLASSGEIAPTLRQAGIEGALADRVAEKIAAKVAANSEIGFEFGLKIAKDDAPAQLVFAQATAADGSGMRITVDAGELSTLAIKPSLQRRVTSVRGELDTESFYTSAVSAGVIDSLISDFVNAFSFDFNLAYEVKAGDVFEVAFAEQVNSRGESVGKPELLYVSLTTAEKSKDLYRFKPPGEKDFGWYDANGTSTVRAFMRTPIDGARISSKFGMRFHPVLKYNRLHGGTDFAAPVGTPIYAAADATVRSASPSRCAGNMAILSHDNGYETRYFHLSKYAAGLQAGKKVRQGETIGYVGNTGTCTTGPHLHYEVHISGKKIDPLSVDTGEAKTLSPKLLKGFYNVRDGIDEARASLGS